MSFSRGFATLVRTLYEAADDPPKWQLVLNILSEQLNASSGMIIALDPELRPDVFHQFGVDEAAQRAYQEHFVARDVVRKRFQASLADQRCFVAMRQSLISDAELERSEYYNDYMRPLGQYHQIGLCVANVGECPFGGISLLRGQGMGEFDFAELQFLRELQPHVEQSLHLSSKLRRLRSTLHAREITLEAYGVAVILLDGSANVQQQSSTAARKLLDTKESLYLDGRRLRARSATEDLRLQQLLRGAASVHRHEAGTGLSTVGGAMLVSGRTGTTPIQVVVSPFHSDNDALGRPSALVFINDPSSRPPDRRRVLRSLFGLTPAECRLADWLVAGKEVKQTAELLHITENNARSVLKMIFRKTGTNSQSALMRLVLTLPGA